MRPNLKRTTDDLLLAQVRRHQELRKMTEHPPHDSSMDLFGAVIVALMLWTAAFFLFMV